MARPEVIVGQIWQDSDKRRIERHILVLETVAPESSPIPLDARIRSCDKNGNILADCPRMFISISRLRTRFQLVRQPDGTVVNHKPGTPKAE